VIKVDEKLRQIYFTASGLDSDQDPYLIHYCSIDFDGKNFKRLTTENGNHTLTFSPDYQSYIDQYSRVDLPPVTLFKSVKDAKVNIVLQQADITDLKQTGWNMPEVFAAKGRDGKTDIWGVIVRPTSFDPKRSYPVIEYIYAAFMIRLFQNHFNQISGECQLWLN
jgi:dipeptidyl aminopeptidase/acylaminoacyl peptidase